MSFLRKLCTASILAASAASASAFSGLTIFGDSLSDTGNIFALTGGANPPPPYFNGRFSNGPVWTEYLAAGLGLPAASTASLLGGDNYAFGGALTGSGSIPSLLAQIGGLWGPTHPVADPNALYVLVGGGNDMRDARSAYQTDSDADKAGRQAAAQFAADNLESGLALLAARGAKHVLVANIPDLGATPEAAALGLQYASSDASARFNGLMGDLLAAGASFGLNMSFLDMAGLAAEIRDDALNNGGAVFGITNVLTPCGPFDGSVGISCNVSLFSDALHPSAKAHALLGAAAVAAVPEPQTWALMALGLLLLAGRSRHHRAAR